MMNIKFNIKKHMQIIVLLVLITILFILIGPNSYCHSLPTVECFGEMNCEYPRNECLKQYATYQNSISKNLQEVTDKIPKLDILVIWDEIVFKFTTISTNIEKMPENEEEACSIVKSKCGYECENPRKTYIHHENKTIWIGSTKEQPLDKLACLKYEWKGYGFRIENNTVLCRWFCGFLE